MKREMVVAVKSILFVAAVVLAVQVAAPCEEPVFQTLAGVRLNGGQQVGVILSTASEEGVISFQIFWSSDATGSFEPLDDAFPASGLDNSEYSGTYAAPVSSGALFLQVVATMGDASTVTSDVILAHDQVIIRKTVHTDLPKNWEARR